MRKPAFCICEDKGEDQLHSNSAADQRLCFFNKDSTIPLLLQSEIPSVIAQPSLSDLDGNPNDKFSHGAAQITGCNVG